MHIIDKMNDDNLADAIISDDHESVRTVIADAIINVNIPDGFIADIVESAMDDIDSHTIATKWQNEFSEWCDERLVQNVVGGDYRELLLFCGWLCNGQFKITDIKFEDRFIFVKCNKHGSSNKLKIAFDGDEEIRHVFLNVTQERICEKIYNCDCIETLNIILKVLN